MNPQRANGCMASKRVYRHFTVELGESLKSPTISKLIPETLNINN
jgi:hypothetical protein